MNNKRIEVDPNKIKAIQNLLAPHIQKEVRGFLERSNYIFKFISQLTDKCDLIFKLLQKHDLRTCDEEC